jgi:hypothetical protein
MLFETGVAVIVAGGGVTVTVTVGGGAMVVAAGVPAPSRRQTRTGLSPYPQGQIIESRATDGQAVIPAGAFQVQTVFPVFSLKA